MNEYEGEIQALREHAKRLEKENRELRREVSELRSVLKFNTKAIDPVVPPPPPAFW